MSPPTAGHLPADREEYRAWLREHFKSTPWGLSVDAGALVGRRRVIFTDRFPFTGFSTDHHIELHADGTGFAALALPTANLPFDAPRLDLPSNGLYTDVHSLAGWTIAFLDVLGRHALRGGASGDLSVRARLVTGEGTESSQVPPGKRELFGTSRSP